MVKILSHYTIVMEHLHHKKYILYVFLATTAFFGWFVSDYEASLVSKYNPLILILIDAIATLLVLAVGLPIYYKGDTTAIRKQVQQLSLKEALSFLGLGVAGVAFGAFGTLLLAHHGVSYYKSSNDMIDLLVGIAGVFIFTRKELSWRKKLGVVLMGLAAYLFV